MSYLLHQLIEARAVETPDATALLFRESRVDYRTLNRHITNFSDGLLASGVAPGDRVAIYLPKQPETVYGIFGASAAGATMVPLNPLLKPRQLAHILPHCNARVLLTSWHRLHLLREVLPLCPELHTLVLVDEPSEELRAGIPQQLVDYADFCSRHQALQPHRRISTDMVAILYTSGSTGNPKGVVLSHHNMLAGAHSVAGYLHNSAEDRLLAALPLSFDAGLSQLTTAFHVGAAVALIDYLLPRDIIRAVEAFAITGLAGVPPLWQQLVEQPWPPAATSTLRYITNTGGSLPVATTRRLQALLPETDIYLMYGLTEAFRSTYLPPDQLATRPDSIGRAIPNAEVLVINAAGEECAPDEPGELVHRGALVSLGYWRDAEATAARFRPCPAVPEGIPYRELAVWSGDQVRRDAEGYLYFIGRSDDMIKTSGYRVSPTEIEDVAMSAGLLRHVAALGLPHRRLGQAILLVATPASELADPQKMVEDLLAYCRRELPGFMLPQAVITLSELPRNQNGKIDRQALAKTYRDYFSDDTL